MASPGDYSRSSYQQQANFPSSWSFQPQPQDTRYSYLSAQTLPATSEGNLEFTMASYQQSQEPRHSYYVNSAGMVVDQNGTPIDSSYTMPYQHEAVVIDENYSAVDVNSGIYTQQASSGQTQLKRQRTIRNVELKGGKLVLDVPVPDKALHLGKYKDEPEFTHMRYTAVTCDPNDFQKEGFTLRQAQYGRSTELFIVLTMYNENEGLFAKSMTAVMKNIAHLCSRGKSKIWGPHGWQKVVVCIVADGRSKIHPKVLNTLGVMGCYQDGIMKNTVNGKEVAAHLFEYTTQINVDEEHRIRGADAGFVPCQILFCLKEKNAKKINSHRWFFNAFGPILNPNVCALIDVGTKPSGTSLYHLWKAFDKDPSIGGACGEIYAELGTGWHKLLNPLVAAQNFEYKMSNILDKPLESVFGYISVLPGAFSAYRYAAVRDSMPGVGPLSSYFQGEKMHNGSDIFSANMYLAEDRILCFELLTKRKQAWKLKYVKSAKAETDVPNAVPEFISQRRRWLNGSFFASVHALTNFYHIFRSSHGLGRQLVLLFEFLYNAINLLFSWFALSSFYLIFYFLGQQSKCIERDGKKDCSGDPFSSNGQNYGEYVFAGLRYLYLFSIIVTFLISMGNRPQGFKGTYTLIMILNACIMGMMLFMAGYTVYINVPKSATEWQSGSLLAKEGFRDIVVSLASTYGVYIVSSILYFDPWHMITSLLQYLFLLPSFVNILMVYAFCNLHDVSWGTKGDNTKQDLGGVVSKANKQGQQVAEIEFLSEQQDITAEYDRMLVELRRKPVEEKSGRSAALKQEDYFRGFRTRVLLWWVFTNALLIAALTQEKTLDYFDSIAPKAGVPFNPYLTGIFWAVAGLSAIRFVGSLIYIIGHWFGR